MNTQDIAIAIYDTHTQAEESIKVLQRSGFAMRKLSIVGRDYRTEEHVVGYFNTGDRVKLFGKWGALWGTLVGILIGSAFMVVPVLGHVIVLGPLATTLASAIEGAVVGGGLSAFAGALLSIGIPRDSVLRYEAALKADKFLLVVQGTAEDIAKAKDILSSAHPKFDEHAVAV
jgi:uncharacterized membrane protein